MASTITNNKHASPSNENVPPNQLESPSLTFYRDRKRQKTKAGATDRSKPMKSDIRALPPLSRAEKLETLAKIDNELDQNLQIMLWECDCNYVLLEHQFLGVRALAGVPDNFPGPLRLPVDLDESDHEAYDDAVFEWAVKVMKNAKPRREKDRGVLMGDVMGLGKTVQCVAACILRNAISSTKQEKKLPTIIVSPNDAVLTQWHETLIKAGVAKKKVYRFVAKDSKLQLKGDIYVLCNRYDLQTEARYTFQQTRADMKRPESRLFPNTTKKLLMVLKNQYQAEQGKAKNEYRVEKESVPETIVRHLEKSLPKTQKVFRTVVIDEAHFLKNIIAYWGLASGLMGMHAERVLPLSGTPYNNSSQDLATLMAFIDPSLDSANGEWWKAVTKGKVAAPAVVAAVSEWSNNYLVRRDKSVIAKSLPQKITTNKQVCPFPLELSVYESYEAKFMRLLELFKKVSEDGYMTPEMRAYQKFLHSLMIGAAACMRLALIHPVAPSGGRDLTIFFSPSRKTMLKAQERSNRCVCCSRMMKKKAKSDEDKARTDGGAYENLEDGDVPDENDNFDDLDDFIVDDDAEDDDYEEAPRSTKRAEKFESVNKGTGLIVPIPTEMCRLGANGLRHYACAGTCMEAMEECPQCASLFGRLRMDSGKQELIKKKEEFEKLGKTVDVKTQPEDMDIPRQVYCKSTFGGFKASAKLENIISDFEKVPKDEKVIILSFFKTVLDLLEAIFDEKGYDVCRFDGDIDAEERENQLHLFKTKGRILLMSVQTGGTGLNITEANHVYFVDRFWNPFVMEQAEDRAYRLGQTKDVHVHYYDCNFTLDEVMRLLNVSKQENAKIILADGSKLAASTAGLTFKEISGVLGNALRAISSARVNYVQQSRLFMEPLPPSESDVFDAPSGGSRLRGQFKSITDVIADMLGYTIPDTVATAAPKPEVASSSNRASMPKPEFAGSTGEGDDNDDEMEDGSHVVPMEIGSNTEYVKPAAVPSSTNNKVAPMEIGSSAEDVKPAAVPSSSSTNNNATLAFLDDSDDESIPGAMVFMKRK